MNTVQALRWIVIAALSSSALVGAIVAFTLVRYRRLIQAAIIRRQPPPRTNAPAAAEVPHVMAHVR